VQQQQQWLSPACVTTCSDQQAASNVYICNEQLSAGGPVLRQLQSCVESDLIAAAAAYAAVAANDVRVSKACHEQRLWLM
jgi:hypothetical protein